jgi:hypothetical protein
MSPVIARFLLQEFGSTRRSADLQAWCRALMEAGDWKAALAANEEAVESSSTKHIQRENFSTAPLSPRRSWGARTFPNASRWRGAKLPACCGFVDGSVRAEAMAS